MNNLSRPEVALIKLYDEFDKIKTGRVKGDADVKNLNERVSKLQSQIVQLKKEMVWGQDQKPIDQRVFAQLSDIEIAVEKFKRILPETFQAQNAKSNLLKRAYNTIVNAVTDAIQSEARGLCFMGATKNAYIKKLPAKIAVENKKLNSLKAQHIQAVEKRLGQTLKLHDLESEGAPQNVIERQKHKIAASQAKELALAEQCRSLGEKIAALEGKVKKSIELANKGDGAREQFRVLGGTEVEITTADHVKLNGVYLDAQGFRKKLKESGCEMTTFRYQTGADAATKEVQAISMSAAHFNIHGKDVLSALIELKGLVQGTSSSADWSLVHDGDDVLLVRADSLPDANEAAHPLFQFDAQNKAWQLKTDSPSSQNREVAPFDDSRPASGTVILSSGNLGVYEMHKSEAMFYLFKNMNVVLFNFRGYGKSEGTPTENGVKLDMEAAYQLAKTKSQHADQQILFKALCMSGGPAAYVAAKHPETHILLDQTYSDFREFVAGKVESEVEKYFQKHIDNAEEGSLKQQVLTLLQSNLSQIAGKVASQMSPDFNTAKALAANEGQKAIIYTHDDEMMSFRNVEDNLKAISEAGKMEFLTLFSAPGEHGDDILKVRSAPIDYYAEEKRSADELAVSVHADMAAMQKIYDKKQARLQKLLGEQADAMLAAVPWTGEAAVAKLNGEIAEIGKQIALAQASEDVELEITLGRDARKVENTGKNQISHFLGKANLADDILKSDTQLRQRNALHSQE